MKDFFSRYGMWVLVALLAIVLISVFTCSQANASEWYVKAEVGSTFDTSVNAIELSDEPVYGAYVGTAVGPVRLEAGARHVAGDFQFGPWTVETSAVNYTATAYLDLATSENAGFFVGAGPDYYTAEINSPFGSADTEGAGWHVAGGYATRITDRAIFEVAARYGEADLDGIDLTGTSVTAGVRFAL